MDLSILLILSFLIFPLLISKYYKLIISRGKSSEIKYFKHRSNFNLKIY